MYLKFWTFKWTEYFSQFYFFKNIVSNTNKNKYCKFLKILCYFQYKPINMLIPFLVKKESKEHFVHLNVQNFKHINNQWFISYIQYLNETLFLEPFWNSNATFFSLEANTFDLLNLYFVHLRVNPLAETKKWFIKALRIYLKKINFWSKFFP